MFFLNKKITYRLNQNTIKQYLLAFAAGLSIGFGFIPVPVAGIIYVVLGGICIFLAFQNDIGRLLSILPYMVFSEIFIRSKVSFIPYLFMQYVLIAVFALMLLKQGTKVKMHSATFILLILFCIMEYGNSIRSNDAIYARGLVTNTTVLTIVAIWSSFNILRPSMVNKFLNNVKIAGIFLCGYALVRQFTGGNSYALVSSSEAVNGLAPVQISGYLGFSAIVFFFSIMDDAERKNLLVNLILFGVNTVTMVISLSRGGAYFLGIIAALFFIINRKSVKYYGLFILIAIVGIAVYSYVSSETNGVIEERYGEQGSSGRDLLVKAGMDLFFQEPITGVGTGNFNTEIQKRNLYGEQSGAHNEFVRIAAEHGIIGIITYWGFFIVLFLQVLSRSKKQREYALYFLVLFCLIIVHNGLKISVQPLILMLVVATPSFISVKKTQHVQAVAKPAF